MANERVQTNATGQVVLKLKTPWRDGTTHWSFRRWSSCSGWLNWFHFSFAAKFSVLCMSLKGRMRVRRLSN